MELWEMSDGRVWVLDPRGGGYYVSSMLDNGGLSRIGEFETRDDVILFAKEYLRISVVCTLA